MAKEDKILQVMHRLGLGTQENGLLTYAVLGEIWDGAIDEYRSSEYNKGEGEESED